jgi:hypothetical protein
MPLLAAIPGHFLCLLVLSCADPTKQKNGRLARHCSATERSGALHGLLGCERSSGEVYCLLPLSSPLDPWPLKQPMQGR